MADAIRLAKFRSALDTIRCIAELAVDDARDERRRGDGLAAALAESLADNAALQAALAESLADSAALRAKLAERDPHLEP
jgi:hypothetical protein